MIKTIYAILVGFMLAFFIGLGIEAFYPTEKYPEPPAVLQYSKTDPATNPELKSAAEKYDQDSKAYRKRTQIHSRNVSLMAIGASILFMILSLMVFTKYPVFANGFMIGSLLTLIYGIIRGFESDDSKFRFLLICIGLAFALTLGYLKFVKNEAKKSA